MMNELVGSRYGIVMFLVAAMFLAVGLMLAGCQAVDDLPPTSTPAIGVTDTAIVPPPTSTATALPPEIPASATPALITVTPVSTATAPPTSESVPTSTSTATPLPTTPALPARPSVVAEFNLVGLPAAARYPVALGQMGNRLYAVSRMDDLIAIIEGDRFGAFVAVGSDPGAVAIHAQLGQIYVTSESERAIYVIRGRQVVAVWPVRATPVALAVYGSSLYVGLDNGEGVDVLDAESGELQGTIPTGGFFSVLALAVDDVDRKLYVSGYQQTIIVDLISNQQVTSHTFQSYRTLAVDPARGRWYINDYDSESSTQWLVAVDSHTGEEIGRAPLGGDPRQAIVHPETGTVYVANSWSNTVSVIEADSLSVRAEIPVGRRPDSLALDESGRRLFVGNSESHNVVVIDVVSSALESAIPLAILPADMEVDPVRGYLYVAVPATNSLFVLREDGQVMTEVPVGIEPVDLAIDRHNGTLYVVNYVSEDLSVVTPDSWQVISVPLVEAPMAVALDPVRRRVYAGNEVLSADSMETLGSFEISTLVLEGTAPPLRSEVDAVTNRLFAVAFNGVPGSNGGFILYALDASTGEQLPPGLGGLSTTAMLLDRESRRLYSTAGRYGSYKLYVDDPDLLRHIADRPLDPIPVSLAYVPATNHLLVGREEVRGGTENAWGLTIFDSRTLGEVDQWPLDDFPGRMVTNPLNGRVYLSVGSAGRILVIQDVPVPAPPAPTPTLTPSPWHTSTAVATAHQVSLPTPTPCGGLSDAFAPFWSADLQDALGCPVGGEVVVDLAEQPFEGGRMFWRSDLQQIYALTAAGSYFVREDSWVGPEEYACAGDPPAGLIKPKRGFGLIWCSEAAIREQVGWGLEEERGYRGVLQGFDRGLLLLTDRGEVYALHGGIWQRLDSTA